MSFLFGAEHVRRYQETDGAEGFVWREGTHILLLTTVGRRTGRETTTPLIFALDGGNPVIVASNGGAPEHPGWYRNLVKNPLVGVQIEGGHFRARAVTAEGAARERLWALMNGVWPHYAEYQERTDRTIPVVVLERDPTQATTGLRSVAIPSTVTSTTSPSFSAMRGSRA